MDSYNRLCAIWHGLARSPRIAEFVEEQDLKVYSKRTLGEKKAFYAIAMNELRGSLLAGLKTGSYVCKGRFAKAKNSCLPRFLYSAHRKIFDDSGSLLLNYSHDAIFAINRLTAVFAKIKGDHSVESEARLIQSFVETEDEMSRTWIDMDEIVSGHSTVGDVLRRARNLVCRVLANECPRSIVPDHGSGASASGLRVHDRYVNHRYIPAIDSLWPYPEYYYANLGHFSWSGGELQSLPCYVPQAKVLLVPKDCRGPRLISCEPHETMWIQQGLMQKLYDCIERHPLTRRSVMFTDQTHNQRGAKLGAETRSLCTIDLKDASDRVRLDLVVALFPSNWAEALCASRSVETKLPDGRVVPLTKFAPMGSALCFPVMATVIWCVLKASLPPGSEILVYGDDIIVATDCYPVAIRALQLVGLRVNEEKSYATGPFRESCGKEYVDSVDVTPCRLRSQPSDDVLGHQGLISLCNIIMEQDGSNEELLALLDAWYPPTLKVNPAAYGGPWTDRPSSKPGFAVWAWDTAGNLRLKSRRRYGYKQYRVMTIVPVKVKNDDQWSGLFRALVKPRRTTLAYDALPKRIRHKYGWVTDRHFACL